MGPSSVMKPMKRKSRKKLLIWIAIVLLAILLGVSLWQLISTAERYREEKIVHRALLVYKPALPADASPTDPAPTDPADPDGQEPEGGQEQAEVPQVVNESILRMQGEYPNALGWITVPGTNVDYPFTQAKDNKYYLRRGLDGRYLYAGVPFLDYRCAPDFTSANTIVYGHNLRNGTMFGSLEKFRQKEFFDENREFYVFLPYETIRVEIFACLVISPNQGEYLYTSVLNGDFVGQIRADARQFRSLQEAEGARYVTLSTCGYEFSGARIVVVGRIVE